MQTRQASWNPPVLSAHIRPRHTRTKHTHAAGWGESGYFRLERTDAKNPNGPCSIYQAPSYPVKKGSDNPEHSSFCGYFGFTECAPHNRCTCQWNLLDLFCLSWGCEAGEPAEL